MKRFIDVCILIFLITLLVVRVARNQIPENSFSTICIFSLIISLVNMLFNFIANLHNDKIKFTLVDILILSSFGLIIYAVLVFCGIFIVTTKAGEIITIISLLFSLPLDFYKTIINTTNRNQKNHSTKKEVNSYGNINKRS